MIQLNKRLWFTEQYDYNKKSIGLIGVVVNGNFTHYSTEVTWKDVLLGRKLARKRGLIYPYSKKRGKSVKLTKLGKAMMKLTT
jgi:hypothetical protein